jgi:MoaA/NifB/PqqE/SkfB family radical SAM enzyme
VQLDDERYPLHGQWELTCRCNLKCQMCYTDPFNTAEKIRQELSTDEVLRILHDVVDAGCMYMTLTGGEPLARPDFPEIYTAAKQHGLMVTVFTNATLITDRIADMWVVYPPQSIEVSLYGHTRAVYEGTTQRAGSHAACRQGIRRLIERQLPVTLKTPAMTLNKEEIIPMSHWAKSQGLHYQMGEWMRPRLDGSRDADQWQLSADELHTLEPQLGTAWQEHKETYHGEPTETHVCGSKLHKFHIDAYGQLQRCSQNRLESYDLRTGNFRTGFFDVLPTHGCIRHARLATAQIDRFEP